MKIIKNCDMGKYTSFKTGGKAHAMIIPKDMDELRRALSALSKSKMRYMVMGNGTNILVRDSGYYGCIIKMAEAFSQIVADGDMLTAGAGAATSAVSAAAMEAGLSGFEFASGIPGSMGGAVCMNAGAYGGEMKSVVGSVNVLSKDGANEYIMGADDLKYAYRHSALMETGDIVTGVTLKLKKGDKEEIKEKMREYTELRNEKQPVSMPSAGSFFKRPEGHFAGKLIQDCGLMGLSVGGAMVSDVHAGFIVNSGNATATDIVDLMELVRRLVYDKFEVSLEPEVRIIGD